MDYLRSAASAVLSKSSGPFPNFTIGAPISEASFGPTIWSIYEGTKRDDGSPCTIFVFEGTNNANSRAQLVLAKNALRKLRTLRHPDVLKLIDSNETPTGVYIAVEAVRLLQTVLADWKHTGAGADESKKEWIAWGLSKVANALKFINADAASIHGNIRPESIFVSQGGEWKLGGFEVLTAKTDYEGVIWNYGGLLPEATIYAAPEIRQGGWTSLRDQEPYMSDSYSFALLAFHVYNGIVPSAHVGLPPQGSVPATLFAALRRMIGPNAKTRMSVAQLLDTANASGGMWKENRLQKLSEGCEHFMLASERERTELIRSLQGSTDSLPADFLTHRVLPSLVNALNLASQQSTNPQGLALPQSIHATSILPLVLQLGSALSEAKWEASVLVPILKAYTSPDRSVRMMLLELLPSYVERVPPRKASENIWPNLITGFADSSAAIREATLRSVLPLSPKLTDRIRNNDLLRQLAKTQVDVEAGIRTNTTILLGRLAPTLNIGTRKSVLIPAFSRSLKDPFVHARVAGLMALMATSDSYDKDDLARSVLPAISPNLVDKEKLVRDQAEKALEVFWSKIREEVKLMPETILPTEVETEAGVDPNRLTSFSSSSITIGNGGSKGGAPGGLASTAGGAATALAGWAMSGAMTYLSSDATGLRPAATPSAGSLDTQRPPLLTNQSSGALSPRSDDLSRSNSPLPDHSNEAQLTSSSGMGSASPSNHLAQDLIDINDDTSDWSSFETAPAKKPLRRGLPGNTGVRGAKSSLAPSPLSSRPATTSKKGMSSLAQEKLKIREDSLGLDAWEGQDSWEVGEQSKVEVNGSDNGVSKSAAAAFSTPVPSWTAPGSAHPPTLSTKPRKSSGTTDKEASDWSTFPDEDTEAASLSADTGNGSQIPMNKEEKRAQMERQREERRERMRRLKESKGKKLGDSLA
ncbi:ARM repeat-containing protein [Microstroma glucosiphilum]|uniref:ARM repeat-containing protein n=1 Tax=Pseudomicrostroma glucosiphilum TaxID=1684307 RepID=A0A316TX55_9BASI|nr:ARM repeat-containing protein [Pseudomicrostroma glucosiphilum]PWN18036.1 ARM repeat-containing protein [Pseudomicrostroma glucosiphilum]